MGACQTAGSVDHSHEVGSLENSLRRKKHGLVQGSIKEELGVLEEGLFRGDEYVRKVEAANVRAHFEEESRSEHNNAEEARLVQHSIHEEYKPAENQVIKEPVVLKFSLEEELTGLKFINRDKAEIQTLCFKPTPTGFYNTSKIDYKHAKPMSHLEDSETT